MKKIKAFAKVNLTLDIVGTENGYHNLQTVVSSINIYDKVKVSKRKDNLVNLKMKGLPTGCDNEHNNAYKTAVAFIKRFNTCGVNIEIEKNIPIGGGLGGSSADIAGVLNALKKLFNVKESLLDLANELGSDSGFMLSGGMALLKGRGDKIERLNYKKLYLVILYENSPVNSGLCYKKYDELNKKYPENSTQLIEMFNKNEIEKGLSFVKNDLYESAVTILFNIKQNVELLYEAGAKNVCMTGSGSSVFAVFSKKSQMNKVIENLPKGVNIIKAKTTKEVII